MSGIIDHRHDTGIVEPGRPDNPQNPDHLLIGILIRGKNDRGARKGKQLVFRSDKNTHPFGVFCVQQQVDQALDDFRDIAGRDLQPFWDPLDFPDNPFFEKKFEQTPGLSRLLVLSGPSRNGNHLLHSLLDSHPQLPRVPGEDSTINYLFSCLSEYPQAIRCSLESENPAPFLRSFSSAGRGDRWHDVHSYQQGNKADKNSAESSWSGVQYRNGEHMALFDYQDTEIKIDYPAFIQALQHQLKPPQNFGLVDAVDAYLESLPHLDPEFSDRNGDCKFSGLLSSSGTRGPLDWLFRHHPGVVAVAPIRRFESYYFSFARGFYDTSNIDKEIVAEAWQHWWHKAVDYAILKTRYPDRMCLVNFDHLVSETEVTVREICKFLDLEFDHACLTPTVLGTLTKGNSSHGRSETDRGTVYQNHAPVVLPERSIPKQYKPFWRSLQTICI